MPLIDQQGRIFGRWNLIDAAAIVFAIVLVPAAYGTYLLFRPSAPRIDSVTRVEISREERRIAGGSPLSAKLKVRGTGFNPMLRAAIGDTAAMGFVFENPNSADVLVGTVAPGTHDLVLLDGIQEVARARGAVTVEEPSTTFVRLAGRIVDLDPAFARTLVATPQLADPKPNFAILALGPIEPARERLQLGDRMTDITRPGLVEREAIFLTRCDPQSGLERCAVGGAPLEGLPPIVTSITAPSGALKLSIREVLPADSPRVALVRVRMRDDTTASPIKVGDRDALLDERAAVVTAITGSTITLRLGVDPSREGWRYRGALLVPGADLSFAPGSYMARAIVESITVEESAK
jgi:hypothetical protein